MPKTINEQRSLVPKPINGGLLRMYDNPPNDLDIGSIRRQHGFKGDLHYVTALSVNSDGSLLAFASERLAIVIDPKKKTEIFRYEVSSVKLTSISICGAGNIVAIGDTGGTVVVYDLNDKKFTQTYIHTCCVNHLHIDVNGALLAVAAGQNAFVYSNKSGGLLRRIEAPTLVHSVLLGSWSASLFIELSSTVERYAIKSGELIAEFVEYRDEIVSQNLCNKNLLVKSIGNQVIVWDVLTGAALKRFKLESYVKEVSFKTLPFPTFSFADEDGKVSIFDSASDEKPKMVLKHSEAVSCVTMTDGGNTIFSGSDAVRIWNFKSGECTNTIKGYKSPVIATALSKNERYLYVAGTDGSLKKFDLDSGMVAQTFGRHNGWVTGIATCEELGLLVTSSHDGNAHVYNLNDGKIIHVLKSFGDFLHSVAISPQNGLIAIAGRDNQIILSDIDSGKTVASWKAHLDWVRSLSFSLDGKYLLSAGNDGIARLWSIPSCKAVREYGFHSSELYTAQFSPDMQYVATASQDSTLKIFEFNGSMKFRLQGHIGGVRNLFFQGNDSLISVSLDCTARQWDLNSGKCVMIYRGLHSDWIRSAIVTSKKILILGSRDCTVSFCKVEDGKALIKLHNLDDGFLWTCCDSPEEKSPSFFWTNREDLIEVNEIDQNGKKTLLATDHRNRLQYISLYNSMTRVMSQLKNQMGDYNQFARLTAVHQEYLNQKKSSLLLPSPSHT